MRTANRPGVYSIGLAALLVLPGHTCAAGRASATVPAARQTAAIPAFPGAEGFGALTRGGRGGRVIVVTNRNDSGPGSLRAALQARGPRIVVFRVSGTIDLKSQLEVTEPFVTIAGQTAPGDGICLRNYPLVIQDTHDVIVRYIRSRLGDKFVEADAASVINSSNIIFDHCSLSWSTDSVFDLTKKTGRATVQWCILSEGLYRSRHAKGAHSYAAGWDGKGAGGSSYHHNLLASCASRMPRIDAYRDENGVGPLVDIRNNVIYNWAFNSAYGGEFARMNWVGNYYKYGPATEAQVRDRIFHPATATSRLYLRGNRVDGYPEVTKNNWLGVHYSGAATEATLRTDAPFSVAPVTTHAAEQAYARVLARVGASLRRDAVDTRLIAEVRTRTARFGGSRGRGTGILDSQQDAGGWPALKSEPAPPDGDHDGMPDAWERKYGFHPKDPSDGPADKDRDGYTNVEEYLNRTDPARYVDYRGPRNNVNSLAASAASG